MMEIPSGLTSRRYRLLAAALMRTVWDQLDGESRDAVQYAEEWADGYVNEATRDRFHDTNRLEIYPARAACFSDAKQAAVQTLWRLRSRYGPGLSHGLTVSESKLSQVLLDAIGVQDIDAGIRRCVWCTPLITEMIRAAYSERDSVGALKIENLYPLSDALDDVGCDNGHILAALRSTTTHYRGFWPLEVLRCV